MGIRKIQVTRKIEEIIKGYLYRGRYPSFQTITHHFGQWLRENTPGAPVFSPVKVLRKEKSNSEKYNQHIDGIYQDIQDAYSATINQTNQVMTDFNFLETERSKIIHELASLSKSIDEIILVTENSDYQYYDGYMLSFENTSDIDKEKSTAFIDVLNKEVTLSENPSQSNRILLDHKKAQFETLQAASKHSVLESLSNAFDDNINTAWWHVVKTNELGLNNVMKTQLTVMFDGEEEINYIEYIPHHGKPVKVKVEYTNDGVSFSSIHQQAETDKVTGITVWNFQKIKAKGVRFIFEKTDYDERSGNFFNYYFGAKSINIYKKNYLSEGIMYTNPISFRKETEAITMTTKNDIPFGTELVYEIAAHEKGKALEELIWHPISSYEETKPKHATVVNLNTKENKKVETGRSEATGEVLNGMKVFRLVQDNGEGIISEKIANALTGEGIESFDDFYNPKLFRGINQWRRERTYVPFNGQVPLNSIWDAQYVNRPELIRTDYTAKGNDLFMYRRNGGYDDNFYRFTICIYSDESRKEPLSLSVMATLATGSRKRLGAYAVYVNKQRLSPSNDEVTMPFIKGWNEIQVLYHWGDMQERKDTSRKNLPNETMLGKFNFRKERKVRADLEHMRYVDKHSLYHNISPNNRNYFSVYDRQVILNYLPESCIFQFSYEIGKSEEQNNEIVLRAHLKRDSGIQHTTPKIYNIKLRAR